MDNLTHHKLDKIFSGEINFVFGANKEEDNFEQTTLSEYAIVGKSNVGKSSFINALTSRKALARVSHTPGRTKQINFFKVRDLFYLVDVPGYGYAKVSKKERNNWSKLIYSYLYNRKTLRYVFVLIDGRHGIKENDKILFDLLNEVNLAYSIIYTKCDKISQQDRSDLTHQSLNYSRFSEAFFVSSVKKELMLNFKNFFYDLIHSK